ncbi:MAG: right-handed parallel beta-helix repeat-containing protein [Candidatus Thermoplasmatota archaeon]
MKKKTILVITLLFLSIFVKTSLSLENVRNIDEKQKILYVGGHGPGNYTKIQKAINSSAVGDTVFIYNGTYFENIVVDKSILIIGENRYNTVINGGKNGATVTINAEEVTISNLTITGGKKTDAKTVDNMCIAGIKTKSSNIRIIGNIIKNNSMGVFCVRSSNLTIHDNSFLNDGLTFTPYENDGRPEIKINYFLHSIENNTVNGKPLYYYKNSNDFIVPSDVGQLIAVNCTNMTLKNANISTCDNGILMAYCKKCTIENNSISQNGGIWTFRSCNNVFQYNNLSNNIVHGITLDYSSNNNIIKNNLISNNAVIGVMLEWYSKNNLITKNNLISNQNRNGYQVQSFRNKWDGNYWSNWRGLTKPFFSFLPKIVYGSPIERFIQYIPPVPVNIDFHPAGKPYAI